MADFNGYSKISNLIHYSKRAFISIIYLSYKFKYLGNLSINVPTFHHHHHHHHHNRAGFLGTTDYDDDVTTDFNVSSLTLASFVR